MAPFMYAGKRSMATIGRTFTGIPAYLTWGFIHVLYLIRLGTVYNWARALYLSKTAAIGSSPSNRPTSAWTRAEPKAVDPHQSFRVPATTRRRHRSPGRLSHSHRGDSKPSNGRD
jgi:hypothetical protein